MKSTLLVVALTLAAFAFSVAQTPDGFAYLTTRLYELYSWPQSKGIWNFRLLPSPSGVNIPTEIIFDKKFRLAGVARLKRRISEFPNGTRIIWMDGIASGETLTPESRKLALPPMHTVEQVKRYAGARGVQIEILRSGPD